MYVKPPLDNQAIMSCTNFGIVSATNMVEDVNCILRSNLEFDYVLEYSWANQNHYYI